MASLTACVRLSKVYEGNNTVVNVTVPVRLSWRNNTMVSITAYVRLNKVYEGNNAMVNVTAHVRLKFMKEITQWSVLLPMSD